MNHDALPVLTQGVTHVILHLRDRGGGGEAGVLTIVPGNLHRDGNLVLGLGVAELIDGTGGGRDLLYRVGVGLGVVVIGACFSGQVRHVERDRAKGRRDVVEPGGVSLPAFGATEILSSLGLGAVSA